MTVHPAILLVVMGLRRHLVIHMIVMTGDLCLQMIGMRLTRQVRPLRDLGVPWEMALPLEAGMILIDFLLGMFPSWFCQNE
jgi:hypothetical protein